MPNETPSEPGANDAARPTPRFPRSRVRGSERVQLREELRDVHFPVALRGYDRAAVDRYVQQVNRLIAELEMSQSPESAIRAALDEVSEETRGLLERAHETADEITARSRAMADERLEQAEREAEALREAAAQEARETRETAQRDAQELREAARTETDELRKRAAREAHELTETAAREAQHLRETAAREAHESTDTAAREARHLRETAGREAEELLAAAEARVRELDRNAENIWQERRRLMDNLSAVARQLHEIVDAEAGRFAPADETGSEGQAGD